MQKMPVFSLMQSVPSIKKLKINIFEKCYHQRFINDEAHIVEKKTAVFFLLIEKNFTSNFLLKDQSKFSCTKFLPSLDNMYVSKKIVSAIIMKKADVSSCYIVHCSAR